MINMGKRKYSGFQIVTDQGTVEFEDSWHNALAVYAQYDSATLYGVPADECDTNPCVIYSK